MHSVSAQDAWLEASDSETDINFDDDAMNPHFAYLDESNIRHDVWFLDGVTALNQMRAAHALGIDTFALWRLGSEDRSLWAVWDRPFEAGATAKLNAVPPGQDVDDRGRRRDHSHSVAAGGRASARSRSIPKPTWSATRSSRPCRCRTWWTCTAERSEKKVAITFDDGPDPEWTPKILDVLKQNGAKATFFLIGAEVEKFPGIAKRIYNEGHEIGNHTFTHPDISTISKRYFEVELNLTERLFESKLGVKPVLMRPPYAIDEAPDTADQVRPLEIAQDLGYIAVGEKIDPNDWRDNPRRSAKEIADDVLANLPPCAPKNLRCGNIILLHDGGGDRSQTVIALGMILDGLKERGYQVVPVSELMGKTPRRRHAAHHDQRTLGGVDRQPELLALRAGAVVHHLRLLRRRRADDRPSGPDRRAGDLRSLSPPQGQSSIRTISRQSRCSFRPITKRRSSSARCDRCWNRITRSCA